MTFSTGSSDSVEARAGFGYGEIMILGATLLLLPALPGAQADVDWLSVKEWYATCTLTFTYSGEIRAGRNGDTDDTEWTETETVSLESVLETRGAVPTIYRKGQPNERKLLVPDRDKTSKIARSWTSPGKDKEDLDDQPPGDGQPGDGFSNYEEYRGFMVGGSWKDGDPAKKEIFIRNNTPARAAGGVDLFEKISRLHVHRLDAGQMSDERVVNFNHGYAHAVDQHGLYLFYDPLKLNECWAETDDGRPGLPKNNIGNTHVGTFDNPMVMTMAGWAAAPAGESDWTMLPAELDKLPRGTYRIRLVLEGSSPRECTLRLVPARRVKTNRRTSTAPSFS